MDADRILKTLREGSPDEVKALVQSLPHSGFKGSALGLVGTGNPGMSVVAMVPLITKYCSGENPEVGAALAFAFHRYAMDLYEGGGNHGVTPATLSGLAFQYVNAMNLLGRSEEVLAFTDEYIRYYERMKDHQNVRSLKAARINALRNLGRIDQADEMLQDPELIGNWATDLEIDRLKKKVAALKKSVTEIDSGGGTTPDPAEGQVLIDVLRGAISASVDDPAQREKLLRATDELDPTNRLDPTNEEHVRQMMEALEKAKKFMTGQG